ncbi:hypothetical protein Tco_0022041 [Tanacetum coccineum]
MASQDARLSKFEADYKQQQSKMTNKIDTFLKAINDRMMGALPKDLHLKLPVLKVLAHAPMYNEILDKYVESLELDGRRGFLATASAVIDCVGDVPYWTTLGKQESYEPRPSMDGIGARPPYYAKKDFMYYHISGEWEITRDAEINPFKDVLVFRKMVEFLGTIPINLNGNMWESEELIEKKID